jgi:hypothetical protein
MFNINEMLEEKYGWYPIGVYGREFSFTNSLRTSKNAIQFH